jgi:phospholipase/carboxylesterase
MSLNYLTVPANTTSPQGLIVLLHGWGANARDVQALAPYLKQPAYQYIFPEAPFPHPSTPAGKMWYDLTPDLQFEGTPGFRDRPDVSQSRQQLTDLLQTLAQTTGVPLSRTILAGFSQGGAMTLDVGLSLPLAGLMVLSGYLHAPPAAQSAPPTLMVHGIQDMVVPITAARRAKNALQAQGIAVQYQEYEGMGHEISLLVLEQMQAFINTVLHSSVNTPEETTIG